jgi:hypothetical protein
VEATASLSPSVYDPAYVASCASVLGPASARALGKDAEVLGQVLTTHTELARAQLLAWLFTSLLRAQRVSGRELSRLQPSDVDRPEVLGALVMLGSPAELLRSAAELELPAFRTLPAPQVDLVAFATELEKVTAAAPRLASMRVGVVRSLRLRGRVLGDEVWVGLAPTLEHMAWQAAHECTVSELYDEPATREWSFAQLESEALKRLDDRARAAGLSETHQRWATHRKKW